MSNTGQVAAGAFGHFVITRKDGTVENLGYHFYDHANPWKAMLLDHNDFTRDDGLRKYWGQDRKHRAILRLRLLLRCVDAFTIKFEQEIFNQ
jgi:hypothetical protein